MNTTLLSTATCCHAWAGLCSYHRKVEAEPFSDLIYTDHPSMPHCHQPHCHRAGRGDEREDHILHWGGGKVLLSALWLSQLTRPSSLPRSGIAIYGLTIHPGEGAPPEHRRSYTLMLKGTWVPNVPPAWEGPRCPTT